MVPPPLPGLQFMLLLPHMLSCSHAEAASATCGKIAALRDANSDGFFAVAGGGSPGSFAPLRAKSVGGLALLMFGSKVLRSATWPPLPVNVAAGLKFVLKFLAARFAVPSNNRLWNPATSARRRCVSASRPLPAFLMSGTRPLAQEERRFLRAAFSRDCFNLAAAHPALPHFLTAASALACSALTKAVILEQSCFVMEASQLIG